MLPQYQPVLGKTLKGKENFNQLIHGFAEVRHAFNCARLPQGPTLCCCFTCTAYPSYIKLSFKIRQFSFLISLINIISFLKKIHGCAELEDEGAAQPHRRVSWRQGA